MRIDPIAAPGTGAVQGLAPELRPTPSPAAPVMASPQVTEPQYSQGLSQDPAAVHAAAEAVRQRTEILSGSRLSMDITDHGEVVAKFRDVATGQVVAQLPSAEMLKLHERLSDLGGMLLDKKA